ncbi:MAG: hypothetical protein QOK43_2391 [Acidimicrobiaceae bacterium]|nr:hypothetical protein [Acidimicrobiaceae bacterium]
MSGVLLDAAHDVYLRPGGTQTALRDAADIDQVTVRVTRTGLSARWTFYADDAAPNGHVGMLRAWDNDKPAFTVWVGPDVRVCKGALPSCETKATGARLDHAARVWQVDVPTRSLPRVPTGVRWSAASLVTEDVPGRASATWADVVPEGAGQDLEYPPPATPLSSQAVDDPEADVAGPGMGALDITRATIELHPKTLRFEVRTAQPGPVGRGRYLLRLFAVGGEHALYTVGVEGAGEYPNGVVCPGEHAFDASCKDHPAAYGRGRTSSHFVVRWTSLPTLPDRFEWRAETSADQTERRSSARPASSTQG